ERGALAADALGGGAFGQGAACFSLRSKRYALAPFASTRSAAARAGTRSAEERGPDALARFAVGAVRAAMFSIAVGAFADDGGCGARACRTRGADDARLGVIAGLSREGASNAGSFDACVVGGAAYGSRLTRSASRSRGLALPAEVESEDACRTRRADEAFD